MNFLMAWETSCSALIYNFRDKWAYSWLPRKTLIVTYFFMIYELLFIYELSMSYSRILIGFAYDLLEDRRATDVIITEFFPLVF